MQSAQLLIHYQNYLQRLGFGKSTVQQYPRIILGSLDFLHQRGVEDLTQVSASHLEDYRSYMCSRTTYRKGSISRTHEMNVVCAIKRFFQFLETTGHREDNPSIHLIPPEKSRPLKGRAPLIPYTPSHPRTAQIKNKKLFIAQYKEHLQQLGYSVRSVQVYPQSALMCLDFLESHGVYDLRDITLDHVRAFHSDLQRLTFRGKSLCNHTIRLRLLHVQKFFQFLCKTGKIYADPSFGLEMPKVRHPLPRGILEPFEIEAILRVIDDETPLGKRDKAIIELLYSTGLRNSEIRYLKLHELHLKSQELRVMGKGSKEALVPFGAPCAHALSEYLSQGRSALKGRSKSRHHWHQGGDPYVFLSINGKALNQASLRAMILKYVRKAGITKTVNVHGFRHSCATHLLKNGADIRLIQKLLRHESLDTTQIYTKVEVGDLHEAQRKYHPREIRYHKDHDHELQTLH